MATASSAPSSSSPRTFLVTGAAGFIAARVCELLLEAGHTVVGIDNLNDYYDVRLKDYRLSRLLGRSDQSLAPSATTSRFARITGPERSESGRFTFHRVDIENLPALERIFAENKFDAVFNLAARAGVRYSMAHPHVYLTTNAIGTLNVLECLRKFGGTQMVLASTSSLYAGCPLPWAEDLPVNTPLSPYAASKKAAEMMAYSYFKLYGINTSVLRYFTVFGPAGRPDMSPLRFIKWIDEGKPIELFGDGSQSRDFTYVDDVARGTIAAARPLGFDVINIGGGRNPLTLHQIIAYMEEFLGKKAQIATQPFHQADVKETWADINKAQRLLGWSPTIDPKSGFKLTVEWYLANRHWLKDIVL